MESKEIHPAAFDPARLFQQCTVRRGRRSGPGGQHRNKVETAIVIIHDPTGISAEATERRSQHQNQQVALKRLRLNLALNFRLQRSSGEAVSERWQRYCHNGRVRVNLDNEDFPALLAEVLDVLSSLEMDVTKVADLLGCTTSQLVKFLKVEPRALQQVNRHRERLDLHLLK